MTNSINKDGLVPPVVDLGSAKNSGFQSQVYANQPPFRRQTFVATTTDGGSFQTSTQREPSSGPRLPDENE